MSETNIAPKPEKKPIIFSGIQPSGTLTLGNYIGALRNFSKLQDDYDCIYSIVDMHAITVRQNPADLRRRCMELCRSISPAGSTPRRTSFSARAMCRSTRSFRGCSAAITQFGELSRMTQFKDKPAKHADNINGGPVHLPGADGGGYPALPVGPRAGRRGPEAARRALPRHRAALQRRVRRHLYAAEPFIPKMGARIMSLGNPTTRCPSPTPTAASSCMDKPEDIMRKFKRAVTDCDACVRFDPENKPGISNLLTIYCAATGKTVAEAEAGVCRQGYGVFKPAVGEA